MSSTLSSDLDTIATQLVALYRQAVRSSAADAATAAEAARCLSRALEAIARQRRSLHPENVYETAMAEIGDARQAIARLEGKPLTP